MPWMRAVAGHHGRPVEIDGVLLRGIICPDALADVQAYVAACAEFFDPQLAAGEQPPKESAMKRLSWLVGGLAMLCDWIGSNQDWFEYTAPEYSAEVYGDKIRGECKALQALAKAGLTISKTAEKLTINDALGIPDAKATPLQHWSSKVEWPHLPLRQFFNEGP